VTATQAKLLWAAGMFAAAYFTRAKKTPAAPTPTANVELGVPTVDGVYDGVYWSKRGTVAAPDNPADDPTMRDLIDESNGVIAANGGYPP
jgi:hypothetical protein